VAFSGTGVAETTTTTSTTTTTTVAATTTTITPATTIAARPAPKEELPQTGSNAGLLALLALVMGATGLAIVTNRRNARLVD
jgi:LPXTG-motif cell wall-anchored protein